MQKAPLQEEPLINGRWTAPWHRWLDSISLAFNSLGRQFIDLGDVPNSYIGQAGKVPKVKATEDGLEFYTPSAGVTDHTLLSNIGTNTHSQIDTHIADTSIHYVQTAIDHTAILNRGTNTHAQIDTHIANTSNPHSVTANQVLPSQSGNSGKFLTTDGSNTSWETVSGGGGSSYMPSGW